MAIEAATGVGDGILFVSAHCWMKDFGGNLPKLERLDLPGLHESGVSGSGGVIGVPALDKLSSKILEAVRVELELDVEDVVAWFWRNGVLRGGLSSAL